MQYLIRKVAPRGAIPWVLVALALGPASGACGGRFQEKAASSSGDAGEATSTGAGGGTSTIWDDFPATPILDMRAGAPAPPSNAPDLFGPAGTGDASAAPCLVEPAPGTLYPKNWQRPRFRFMPAGKQNLFELRLKAPNELNELYVYTRALEWTMPPAMWQALTLHQVDVPIQVTIRGAELVGDKLSGPPGLGTSGEVRIAPAAASGAIVYWRTDNAAQSGELKGFSVGDESVVTALTPANVAVKPGGKSVTCIGCHTSTPDGEFAAFKTIGATNAGALASVKEGNTGEAPKYWSMASMDAMSASEFGIPSFSPEHWRDGDRTLITSYGNGSSAKVAWFDLEATQSGEGHSFGFFTRDGDARGGVMPVISHDGQRIVYTSTNSSIDGRPIGDDADLYSIPFADRKGGAAIPLPGAAEPGDNEYYPAFSPDDKLIAYNRIHKGKTTYNQPDAEVFIISTRDGIPVRLAANDPVACSGEKSPGVTNSWPKWAPSAVTVGDRTFYWLTFSSTRLGGLPQLYVTGIMVQGGSVTTYPALYLWNQPSDESNHTPAWALFNIPKIPK